jgi:hypothetical protein
MIDQPIAIAIFSVFLLGLIAPVAAQLAVAVYAFSMFRSQTWSFVWAPIAFACAVATMLGVYRVCQYEFSRARGG